MPEESVNLADVAKKTSRTPPFWSWKATRLNTLVHFNFRSAVRTEDPLDTNELQQ